MREAAAHAFVVDLDAPELSEDDRRHLQRVLRLRAGEDLTVSDGAGRWRMCRFADPLEPVGKIVESERPSPLVTVALALTKGERLDWAVQKLSEVGVDVVVPFAAARSVVRWDGDRAAHHVDRAEPSGSMRQEPTSRHHAQTFGTARVLGRFLR